MDDKPKVLTREPRPIRSLVVDYNQRVHDWNISVGQLGITKIVAYDEPGQSAYTAWFAAYIEDEMVWRINGHYVVEVYYEPIRLRIQTRK